AVRRRRRGRGGAALCPPLDRHPTGRGRPGSRRLPDGQLLAADRARDFRAPLAARGCLGLTSPGTNDPAVARLTAILGRVAAQAPNVQAPIPGELAPLPCQIRRRLLRP